MPHTAVLPLTHHKIADSDPLVRPVGKIQPARNQMMDAARRRGYFDANTPLDDSLHTAREVARLRDALAERDALITVLQDELAEATANQITDTDTAADLVAIAQAYAESVA